MESKQREAEAGLGLGHTDPLIYRGTTEQLPLGLGSDKGVVPAPAPAPAPAPHWHLYWAAASANLLALAAGCVLCWTSPVLPQLLSPNSSLPLTEGQAALVASLTPLGAAVGPVPAGLLADRLGRKPTLLGDATLFLLSWVLIAFASSPVWLYAARFIAGFATGCIFAVLPMYIGEIAVDSVRSTLGSLMQLSLTVGFMIPYGAGPYIAPVWLAVASGVVPLVFAACFFPMPESPGVLLARGDTEAASSALQWLRGKSREEIRPELNQLMDETNEALARKKPLLQMFVQMFKTRGNVKALYLGCGLLLFQQFSGINAVLFYAEGIFKKTGSELSPALCTIIIGVVMILASAGTLSLTARFSMKHLLIFSGVGMAVAHALLGYYFYLAATGGDTSAVGALPVGSLVFYIIVYCFGFGPLPWAVLGELFAPDVKAVSSSVCASFCWLLGFLVTQCFSSLLVLLGEDYTFWALGACCALAAVFTLLLLPNTRGKSLKEIQDMLNAR